MLQAFLESISLHTDLDNWDNGTNVLTLMTLHTAKGLEFPIVYMVGMEEGIFPNVNSYTDDPDDLEEERRLCYVGITRAKDKLTLIYARQRRLYGSLQQNLPSRFMNEIPQHLFETAIQSLPGGEAPEDDDISPDMDDDEIRRRILFD
jgi:DNA helicase II / ATP-dependent DNA helicase PcrA